MNFLLLTGCCAVIETFLKLCSVRKYFVDDEPSVYNCTQVGTQACKAKLMQSSELDSSLRAAAVLALNYIRYQMTSLGVVAMRS